VKLADVVAEVDAECRKREIPMLGRARARRLAELVREVRPRLVVEVGTAIGYSGLWIARALRKMGKGRLVTFEQDPERAAEAGRNFRRAGVDRLITQIVGDARQEVAAVQERVDLLFLDGGFGNYSPCLMNVRDRLRDSSIIVADNAAKGAAEMADYLEYVRRHYDSHSEWFDTGLPWDPRDAMEISIVRSRAAAAVEANGQ